ncbi:hypothetical protein CDD83_7304 [Cordyceps sp. RAO-2017]|nr:hypothetical protein CDD83_7304 [Cordyceps sp. RAO-2017]
MKVIVTGATGQAGREVVQHCIDSPQITKVVILTRRAVCGDVESHPKIEVVMQQDFSHYPEAVLRRLEGAEACLWTIGSRADQAKHDKEADRRVGVEFPITAARTLCAHVAEKATPPSDAAPFRFIFCSSKHASRSRKPLLFASDTRRLAAEAEKGLLEVADGSGGRFETYILRPAAFRAAASDARNAQAANGPPTMRAAQVGRAMVSVACNGRKGRLIENEALEAM